MTGMGLLLSETVSTTSSDSVGSALSSWTHGLVIWTVDLGIVAIAAAMLMCIIRLIRGSHLADRVLAVDTLGIMLIGMVILLSMRLNTVMFFDSILVLSLLAFAGTVAMGQYIGRPHMRRGQENASGP